MSSLYIKVYIFVIIVVSAIFHEYAHGLVAYKLGDDTAKKAGRLTLNPLVHIDLFGTILLPLLLMSTVGVFIGWAKPVPYNPINLSDKKYGSLKVAVAGPSTNILLAILMGIIIRMAPIVGLSSVFVEFLAIAVYINLFLAIFNLIPIPPLDGSKILFDLYPPSINIMKGGMVSMFIALFLAFYLIPPIASILFRVITGLISI